MSDDSNKPKMDVLVAGHDYDGIQEFNNPAPFWWQLFFYISIVWGIAYIIYYIFMGGPTLQEELTARMQEIQTVQQVQPGAGGPDESMLAAAMGDEGKMSVGAKVYVEKCAACHAADGGGMIGPNLTDNYWIHGQGKPSAIYEVVKNGVADKGMPPWGALLSEDEMAGVVAYVKSLKGKPVATAKPPQGDLVNE